MKSGRCTSCGSTTVYTAVGGVGIGTNQRLYVYTGAITRAVPFDSYVCATCGYFENFIQDAGKLAEVAQKWQQVPPADA